MKLKIKWNAEQRKILHYCFFNGGFKRGSDIQPSNQRINIEIRKLENAGLIVNNKDDKKDLNYEKYPEFNTMRTVYRDRYFKGSKENLNLMDRKKIIKQTPIPSNKFLTELLEMILKTNKNK